MPAIPAGGSQYVFLYHREPIYVPGECAVIAVPGLDEANNGFHLSNMDCLHGAVG